MTPRENRYPELAAESGVIGWSELQRHFARGVVVVVSGGVDLLDAADRFAHDDRIAVSDWLAHGKVAQATDQQAHHWQARQTHFRAIVVAPWVLVQPLETVKSA